LQEGLDGERDVIGVCALWQSSGNDLDSPSVESRGIGMGPAHLVNESTTVDVVRGKNLSPELQLTALYKVARLLLEHRVVVRDSNELVIAETLGIRNVRKVRITSLAEFTDNQWLI